jgi:hypothetical protein
MQKTQSVAALISKLKENRQHQWQYLEVKQLAEILARHREKLRLAIREYRLLKTTIAAETDAIEKLYLNYEGMFLRDHLRDALRLYVMINHDYHEAYAAYLEEARKPADMVIPVPAELLPAKTLKGKSKAA